MSVILSKVTSQELNELANTIGKKVDPGHFLSIMREIDRTMDTLNTAAIGQLGAILNSKVSKGSLEPYLRWIHALEDSVRSIDQRLKVKGI